MTALVCPDCGDVLAPQDRWCGACGRRLASMETVRDEVPVGDRIEPPRLAFRNTGVVPVHVHLPRVHPDGLPAWLVLPAGSTGVHAIPPAATVEIPLAVHVEGLRTRPDAPEQVTVHDLVLRTDADLHDQARSIRLTLVGRSAIQPPIVEFPCLSRDHDRPIPLPFGIANGGGRPLLVEQITVRVLSGPPELAGLLDVPRFLDPLEVAPGKTLPLSLFLAPPSTVAIPDEPVVRGALGVVCHHPLASGLPPTEGTVIVTLARTPRLEVVATPGVQHVIGSMPMSATIRNAGALPIEVIGATCPASWVRVEQGSRRTLDGGASMEVRWTVLPHARTGADLRATRLRATIAIETLPPLPEPGHIDVDAEVEEVQELDLAALGIDFGTTNSAIAVFHPDKTEAIPLALEGDPERAFEMPSLLFFTRADGGGPFVFGNKARNRANMEPGNLVRSLKRVLTRYPDREWHFAWSEGEERRFDTWRTDALVEALIAEMVVRSVQAYRELPTGRRPTRAGNVRFTRAVFTHPVKVTDRMVQTLWQAARATGLHGGTRTAQEFRDLCMIDEASAAIIHYLWWREANSLPRRSETEERVLCFDIGGGTTDVTAIHAGDPMSDVIEVSILHTGGDNRFGGEDLDRIVAELVLNKARQIDPSLRGDLVLEALDAPEPRALRARLSAVPPAELDLAANRVFRAALNLIEQAEKAKISLGEAATCTILLPADFPRGAIAAPGRDPVEVVLMREEVEQLIRVATGSVLGLLDKAIEGAHWAWTDVDTLLFTGQTSRSAVVRDVLTAHVMARRGPHPLLVVDPVGTCGARFDPKGCVAAGAARFGCASGGIRVRVPTGLPFSLSWRNAIRAFKIPGLEVGAALPARGKLVARQSPFRLVLFADDRVWANIQVHDVAVGTEVTVVCESEEDIFLEWGDGRRAAFSRQEGE